MNLPVSFIDYTRALLGNEEYEKLSVALGQEPPVSIRLNQLKIESGKLKVAIQPDSTANSQLSTLNSQLKQVPWCKEGYYLDQRLTFTFDPLFHAGCYYVQEASSMFVGQVLQQYLSKDPVVMLDLCAAPGGKSTHACSLLPVGSLLVANEVIRNRSQVLAENLTKWGYPAVVVTNNDPADFSRLGSFFDVILTDVPCSGEGMFRKDPRAIEEWSPHNVEICWQRQRRIIADIWQCLKPGGILIYSTCTYNTKEDEENVRWICDELGAEALPLAIPSEWNIIGSLLAGTDFPVYRFLPHKIKGEGFFLAALRKPKAGKEMCGAASSESFANGKAARKKASAMRGKVAPVPIGKEQLAMAKSWLAVPEAYELSVNGNTIAAFPKDYADELATLQQFLRIVQAGITVGEVKGKDLIPDHALAMSRALQAGVFFTEEIDYEQAIAYLRKEAISLSETAPRGYVLLTYRSTPLGFVKNIGNRANNLYPQEWRIRSGYLPEEIRVL
ncbi:rRNA cytosine-C5-methyltransferase [Bacteroides sp.]|uniref:methyltransferase RsmF C-terminal domain-like protein n=1 Tax=Bacteroides sp. TaxID=29523 RepID=UPI0025BFF076|nr:rRNA cytosine-C5-methyltransferase [Bacteroides sp.]